jgi:hypothetical protein
VTFGNGAPWQAFRDDPRLNIEEVQSIAGWFLVARPKEQYDAPAGLSSSVQVAVQSSLPKVPTVTKDLWEDPTGSIDTKLPRSPSGSFLPGSGSTRVVFRLRRKPAAQFDWISVGRNENNDVFLPDTSVSRFHAFFRETPSGGLLLQDARSANGTLLHGIRVPRQGEGSPLEVSSGDAVRFGDIHGVILDAAGLLALAKNQG